MPWSLKTWSMKIWATVDAVNGWWRAQKWAYLESRSTTTIITDLFPDLGKPVIKSIDISFQISGGIGSGWSVPRDLTVSPLLRWHTSHSATNLQMSCFIPSQKKERLTLSYVLVNPECPVVGVAWSSESTVDLILDCLLKYKRPLYLSSSWSQEYPGGAYALFCSCWIRCELLGSCSHSWCTACSQSGTMKEREKMDPSSSYFRDSASATTLSLPFL